MRTWAEPNLTPDGAYICQTSTVWADLLLDDTLANYALQRFVEGFHDVMGEGLILSGHLGDNFLP